MQVEAPSKRIVFFDALQDDMARYSLLGPAEPKEGDKITLVANKFVVELKPKPGAEEFFEITGETLEVSPQYPKELTAKVTVKDLEGKLGDFFDVKARPPLENINNCCSGGINNCCSGG